MQTVEIKIKKLDPRASLPTLGSLTAAGADLRAVLDGPVTIAPGETYFAHLGFAAEIPQGYAGFIFARSGLSAKQGLAPANKVGVVDSDYRGEFIVALHNHGSEPRTIENGDRIAQLVILPVAIASYVECEELSDTERGSGGFGSTGTK